MLFNTEQTVFSLYQLSDAPGVDNGVYVNYDPLPVGNNETSETYKLIYSSNSLSKDTLMNLNMVCFIKEMPGGSSINLYDIGIDFRFYLSNNQTSPKYYIGSFICADLLYTGLDRRYVNYIIKNIYIPKMSGMNLYMDYKIINNKAYDIRFYSHISLMGYKDV